MGDCRFFSFPDKGIIERYNYHTNNYSTLGEIHNFQTENISSIQSGSHYIYYTWNNSFTSIYTINKTDLSVENYTYRNYNMTHLLFFNGNYVFYNLNGDMTFANGDKIMAILYKAARVVWRHLELMLRIPCLHQMGQL